MRRKKLPNQETPMTLSDLTSKTPEELNVMCAELRGWIDCEICAATGNVSGWAGDNWADVPNYTGSWDAIMPEVRKASAEQSMAFIEHLRAVLDIKATGEYAYTWMVLTATAQQLTIALILTLTSQH